MLEVMAGPREEESASFLKKRSKKLLCPYRQKTTMWDRRDYKSFLLLFFKKEALPSYTRNPPATPYLSPLVAGLP
jgi:hypothetical protein